MLWPLLEAESGAARDAAVEALIAIAQPIIDGVLARATRGIRDAEEVYDLRAKVVLRLLRRLHDVGRSDDTFIAKFDSFVAKLTYNVVNDAMRDLFPGRTRLKNRIRYLLRRGTPLAMWHTLAGLAAGYARMNGSSAVAMPVVTEVSRDSLDAAVRMLIDAAGGPLLVDDVVDVLAISWQIEEPELVVREIVAPPSEKNFEQRQELELLWSTIRDLPMEQRHALLLNLRDPQRVSAIELFVIVGVATFDDIAAALAISSADLAALLVRLPLDDNEIASRLGVTRQRVINVRRLARERLTRTLRSKFFQTPGT